MGGFRKKNQTLPLTPVEVGEQWYALARLGYSTWAMKCWSRDDRHGHVFVYFSRVMEKSAAWAICLKYDVMKKIKELGLLRGIRQVHSWFDAGNHFRSYAQLGSAALHLPQAYRRSFVLKYGLESHMKGDIDGIFGNIAAARDEAAGREPLLTVGDLCRVLSEHYRQLKELDPGMPEYHFYDYLPETPKSELAMTVVGPKSCPLPLTHSYSWAFTLMDERRRQFMGKQSTITGTLCRASVLPGLRCIASRTCHVKSVDMHSAAKILQVEEEGAPALLASELEGSVMDYKGWRVSDRKIEPEDLVKNLEKLMARLKSKRKVAMQVQESLPKNAKRTTGVSRRTLSVEYRKQRDKRIRAHFKGLRDETWAALKRGASRRRESST